MDKEHALRRVVTGHDRDGKSIIVLDDGPGTATLGGAQDRRELTEIQHGLNTLVGGEVDRRLEVLLENAERAMYFSLVTFTTLGYGDVTLPGAWGLLAACQAALGLFIFGWSTAIVIAAVQRIHFQLHAGE